MHLYHKDLAKNVILMIPLFENFIYLHFVHEIYFQIQNLIWENVQKSMILHLKDSFNQIQIEKDIGKNIKYNFNNYFKI